MYSPQTLGFIYGLSSYILWGTFPLFFYTLRHVEPTQVLTHRVIWSCVLVTGIVLLLGRHKMVLNVFRSRSTLILLLFSSLLIAINWLVFIWAVGQGRVLESSLGYFLTPLVSVLLARLFLKEQLDSYRWIACGLALIGVVWQVVNIGSLPWISLTLAGSFGLYGLVRKQVPVDSLTGLSVETALLLPIALIYWLYLAAQQQSQFTSTDLPTLLLLIASGALTALPLLLFAAGAKKLSLTAIGFMMYINPTMQFLIAIFLFHEAFSTAKLIGFIWIWAGLSVFTWGAIRQHHHAK